MAHGRNDWSAANSKPASAAYPPLAVPSMEVGKSWRETYRTPYTEQVKIVQRLIVAAAKAHAKRYGLPEPIITEVKVRPLPDGGYEVIE